MTTMMMMHVIFTDFFLLILALNVSLLAQKYKTELQQYIYLFSNV